MVSTTAADKFSRPSVINPLAFLPLREFKKKKKAEKYRERKLGQNLSLMKFGEFVLIVAGNEGWKF